MTIPPGLVFLAKKLPILVLRPVTTFVVTVSVVKFGFNISPPYWVQVPLFLSLFPITFLVHSYGEHWVVLHHARKRGAVLPPTVTTKRLGGIDILERITEVDLSGYYGAEVAEWAEQYGHTFRLNFLVSSRIVSNEPEHVKAFLGTEFESFEKGKLLHEQLGTLLGTGVFNSDGEMWKLHRGMTRPYFSKDRISHFEIFNRHAEDMIVRAKERLRAGYAIDFQDLVARFTFDSATEFLFGHNVKSLSAGLPYPENTPAASSNALTARHPANRFLQAFAKAQEKAEHRVRGGKYWRLLEFWKNDMEEEMSVIDGFLRPIILEAVSKNKAAGDLGQEDESLLEHMARLTQDYDILKDETLNIMIAGRDTTASTLTFCLYLLSQHPDAMSRLREEILSSVGSDRGPSIEELRGMKYLRAVINETLRLFPPVPINMRFSVKDTVIPAVKAGAQPFFIPAGISCLYSVWQIHRRTDLWGPDALQFDPDRFLDARLAKYLTPNPYIFVPFNAGPRLCLGQQLAYNEISFMLVRLLQAFSSVALAPDAQPAATSPPVHWKAEGGRAAVETVWPKAHLTLYAKGGLWVRMTEAKESDTA